MVRSDGTARPPLIHGPGLRSISSRIRRDPHRGCSRRISTTATSTASTTWRGHECGRWDRSANPASLLTQIPRDPAMQRRPMHTYPSGDLDDISPCQHSPDRVQALLDNRQDNQSQSRPPEIPTPRGDIEPRLTETDHCRRSPGGRVSRIT